MILTITANPAIDIVYFVDRFDMGEVHRPIKMTYTAGGKGLNVARVSLKLGAEVGAMGFVGDFTGEYIKAKIEEMGIKNLFTQIKGETRRCINIADASGKSGEILESGPEISAEEADRFLETFSREVDRYDIVCVSGSLPKGLESNFYCKLVDAVNKKNKKIIIDTSGAALKSVIEAKPFMIKPNRFELSKLLEREITTDDDVKSALKLLYDKGIRAPMITLGKDGAMTYDGSDFYKFTPPTVKVKNSVGSGDSTSAGIAVGLDRGMELLDAIRLGMAAGVTNTQYEQTGVVSQEEVAMYYKEIKCSKV